MKRRIVPIRNSRVIPTPTPRLNETGSTGEVDTSVQQDRLIIQPIRVPRSGWNVAFQQMRERGDDALIDGTPASQTQWDAEEWEW